MWVVTVTVGAANASVPTVNQKLNLIPLRETATLADRFPLRGIPATGATSAFADGLPAAARVRRYMYIAFLTHCRFSKSGLTLGNKGM